MRESSNRWWRMVARREDAVTAKAPGSVRNVHLDSTWSDTRPGGNLRKPVAGVTSNETTPIEGRLEVLAQAAGRNYPSLVRAAVIANDHLGDRYWRMQMMAPDIASNTHPGQFVMLTVTPSGPSNWVLPRPMAVADRNEARGSIDIVYGTHGWGTRQMAEIRTGDELTVVGPLGNGFWLDPGTRHLLVVGRGIGLCSLSLLAVAASKQGVAVSAVLSARHPEANVLVPFFEALPHTQVLVALDTDGSSAPETLGPRLKALLDDAPAEQIATCGSRRLLRMSAGLAGRTGASLQVAMEAHMACGMGYCHGCSAWVLGADQEGPLVCRDGPVFAWSASTQ